MWVHDAYGPLSWTSSNASGGLQRVMRVTQRRVATVQRMRYSIVEPAASRSGGVPWIRKRSPGGVRRARLPGSEKKAKTSAGEAATRWVRSSVCRRYGSGRSPKSGSVATVCRPGGAATLPLFGLRPLP